jgi:hypothetical protein
MPAVPFAGYQYAHGAWGQDTDDHLIYRHSLDLHEQNTSKRLYVYSTLSGRTRVEANCWCRRMSHGQEGRVEGKGVWKQQARKQQASTA